MGDMDATFSQFMQELGSTPAPFQDMHGMKDLVGTPSSVQDTNGVQQLGGMPTRIPGMSAIHSQDTNGAQQLGGMPTRIPGMSGIRGLGSIQAPAEQAGSSPMLAPMLAKAKALPQRGKLSFYQSSKPSSFRPLMKGRTVNGCAARDRSRSPPGEPLRDFNVPDAFWSTPLETLVWNNPEGGWVKFRAFLVAPPGREAEAEALASGEGLPLAFFYSGLGEQQNSTIVEKLCAWREVASEPFVLAAAKRPEDAWWFVDDNSHWGWLSGEFRPELVRLFDTWMADLASRPGINRNRVGLFGFSAGAYAVAELFAYTRIKFSGIGFGCAWSWSVDFGRHPRQTQARCHS